MIYYTYITGATQSKAVAKDYTALANVMRNQTITSIRDTIVVDAVCQTISQRDNIISILRKYKTAVFTDYGYETTRLRVCFNVVGIHHRYYKNIHKIFKKCSSYVICTKFIKQYKNCAIKYVNTTNNMLPRTHVYTQRYTPELTKIMARYLSKLYRIDFFDDETIFFSTSHSSDEDASRNFWNIGNPEYIFINDKLQKHNFPIDLNKYICNIDIVSAFWRSSCNVRNINILAKYLDSNKFTKLIEHCFRTKSIFGLQSAMGTGKSSIIAEILRTGKRCLLVATRRALYDKYMYDYSSYNVNVVMYNMLSEIPAEIVQEYDAVIIDEATTLVNYICNASELRNFAVLAGCFNKTVFALDACLTESFFDIFSTFTNKQMYFIKNLHVKGTCVVHGSEATILDAIDDAITQQTQKRITISAVSKATVKKLTNKYSKYGAVCITADTPAKIRDNIINDFQNNKIRILIYSPALSIGVDIQTMVDVHFHIDIGVLVSLPASIQMTRRIRTAKRYEIFVRKRTLGYTLDAAKPLMDLAYYADFINFNYAYSIVSDTNGLTAYGVILQHMLRYDALLHQSEILEPLLHKNFKHVQYVTQATSLLYAQSRLCH